MSRNFISLEGKRFGKLLVISSPLRKNKITYYTCVCDCGNIKEVRQASLNTKNLKNATRSCGCRKFTHKDLSGKRIGLLKVIKHVGVNNDHRHMYSCSCECGRTVTASSRSIENGTASCVCKLNRNGLTSENKNLYAIWRMMNSRCSNALDKKYAYYGARGITVCYRWSSKNKKGFLNFFEDFKEKYVPLVGMSFDRIDNNKGYCPKNIRIVDAKTQANNTRKNKKIYSGGKIMSMEVFSKKINVPYNTLRSLLLKKTPSQLINFYYERGKIDRSTYEATKDATWYLGSEIC